MLQTGVLETSDRILECKKLDFRANETAELETNVIFMICEVDLAIKQRFLIF